jgi:hypothetical protein
MFSDCSRCSAFLVHVVLFDRLQHLMPDYRQEMRRTQGIVTWVFIYEGVRK